KQVRGVLFYDDLLFEIKTGAIAPVFMNIAGIAVGAAVLAALVGVHAVPHADVGTIDFIDDAFCRLFEKLCFGIGFQPIVYRLDMFLYFFVFQETILWIELGTPALY